MKNSHPKKALWSGHITLGQLGVAVRMYSSTCDPAISFVQLHEADGSPTERRLFCRAENRRIDHKEIIRAVKTDNGSYITFSSNELETGYSTQPKTFQIRQFAHISEISPLYFEKSYYIVPRAESEYAYALLREVLERLDRVAIGYFQFFGSEYTGCLQVVDDVIALHRLRYTDEILPYQTLDTPPLPTPARNDVERLSTIVDKASSKLHLRDYHNEHEKTLLRIIEHKQKGLPEPSAPNPTPNPTSEEDISSILTSMSS